MTCFHGNSSSLSLLIQHGGELDVQNSYGSTPLHHACSQSNSHCVTLLLKHGARTDILNSARNTAVDCSRERLNRVCAEIITDSVVCCSMSLADAVAQLSAVDTSQKTRLFLTNIPDLIQLPEFLRSWPDLCSIAVTNCARFDAASVALAAPPKLSSLELLGTAPFPLDLLSGFTLAQLKTDSYSGAGDGLRVGCALSRSLRILDLSGASVAELPASIYNLSVVMELLLGDSALAALPAIPAAAPLARVFTLDLRNTRLTALPEGIEYLQALRSLDVNSVLLEQVPWVLGALPFLHTARGIANCPFVKNLPEEHRESDSSVLNYVKKNVGGSAFCDSTTLRLSSRKTLDLGCSNA
eukprot:TRINITY_DN15232_c0_g1_i1.p1 TRINITY_DN15232_c0_g1~~TRINITY_DN15232_c0_g1_i1.p1  ORF type:complete len:355 (+),score=69.57 TRINITY_DN15232_c0_g1_i1:1206-2270(+)